MKIELKVKPKPKSEKEKKKASSDFSMLIETPHPNIFITKNAGK